MYKFLKFLGLTLLVFCLVACGDIERTGDTKDTKPEEEEVTTVSREEDTSKTKVQHLQEISEYATTVSEVLSFISMAMGNLSDISSIVSETPQIVYSKEFSDSLNSNFDVFEVAIVRMSTENVPEGYEEVNRLLIESFEIYASARGDMFNGMLEMDVERINRATVLLEEGSAVMQQANVELLKVNAENGL